MSNYCKEKGFGKYFATSAKDNTNIEEAAKFLIEKIMENEHWQHRSGFDQVDTIELSSFKNSQMKLDSKSCKC